MADGSTPRRPRATRTARPPRGEQAPRKDVPPTENDATDTTTEETVPNVPPVSSSRKTAADKKLAEALAQTYQMVGMGFTSVGFARQDAGLIGTGTRCMEMAEPISDAWIDLANKNPRVKKALQGLVEASAVGTLVALHVPIMLPLLASRGVIPDSVAAFGDANGGFSPAGE